MNLTRHNYEEYFLLYVDGELAGDDRLAVEAFLQEHPDLGEQMDDLRQTVLSPADDVFTIDKTLLYRPQEEEAGARIISINRRRLSAAAAAVAIALLATSALWIVRRQNHSGPAAAGAQNATAIATPPGDGAASGATTHHTTAAGNPSTDTAQAAPAIAAGSRPTAPTVPGARTIGPIPGDRTTAAAPGARATAPAPSNVTHPEKAPWQNAPHDALVTNNPSGTNPVPQTPVGIPQDMHTDGTIAISGSTPRHTPLAINDDSTQALAINNRPTVTRTSSPTYHTLEDGNQEASNDRILFVPADQVVNGEVKGFFRRAGRLIKRSASLNNDVVRPESDR
ncbi:MAG TPA: hypothetical protein VL547_04250 [Dinghuibacter sp.]|uniref:anti-sigma factor family protein n=1 Tax=Dinghuibacter sp. TaxID=2024697 RepID=UPI002C9F322D|nr:hypothetical protein [Dinghuibacter sp.]HTJ11205.1 hypothetical protein [Dinghuibacter sp.]